MSNAELADAIAEIHRMICAIAQRDPARRPLVEHQIELLKIQRGRAAQLNTAAAPPPPTPDPAA